ncbi:MAG: glycosyltransferase family 4 protein [Clostridiales bacterium]|nr:glycosyltransferase family 4 protein [Clostridiales bacterium]
MNIAIITDTYFPDINGVTSSIHTLAIALRKRGHRVYVFVTSENISPIVRRVGKNPPVFRIPSIPMLLVRPYRTTMPYSFRLVQILKRLKIDIIHTQTEFSMGLVGLSSSMTLHLPIVHTYHTMLEDYTHYILGGKVKKIITPEVARKYSKSFCNVPTGLIVPTEKVKNALRDYGVKKPIYVIPTGIDVSPFNRSNFKEEEIQELKDKFGIRPNEKILLSLGRVAKEKSIDKVIEQVPAIRNKMPNVRLLIVGDGPALEDLKKQAANLGVSDKIIFAGAAPYAEIGKYYQLGDAFISCSTSETQGLTYYEAMAAGLPVIARNDDAVNELFKDGENARLFKHENEIADIVADIFKDPVTAERYSSNAEKTVASYSAETFASRVEEAYMNAISRHVREKAMRRSNVGKLHSSKKYSQTKLVPPEEDKHFLKKEEEVAKKTGSGKNPLIANARKAYHTANRYAQLIRVGRKVKARKAEEAANKQSEKKEQ